MHPSEMAVKVHKITCRSRSGSSNNVQGGGKEGSKTQQRKTAPFVYQRFLMGALRFGFYWLRHGLLAYVGYKEGLHEGK